MCGTCNGNSNSTADEAAVATNGPTTSNGTHPVQGQPKSSPYQSVQDYLSNVGRYKIIESTLREGEQFVNSFFDTETKIKIAKALDSFGVDYIELTNPCSSPQSFEDCKTIANLGLKAKILTHVRCHMDDAKKAIETGVHGVDLVIGTSSYLREFSHGKSMEMIQKTALEVIAYVKSQGVEVRFSSEDSFRSDLVDLLTLYKAVDNAGVNRVGIADTVGGATPRMVYDLVRTLRDIECHFHNDTGCAVANAHSALEAGATHIDTSVLGIGERNGITSLGGLESSLKLLSIHAKAILANPSTYEIISPEDFGLSRYVSISSRITGWNAVRNRADQLGLHMTDDQVKEVTAKIKQMADIRPLAIDDTDSILRSFHLELQQA
ncbi:hypothetical protein DL769_002503 [Monosporascus sp. CRB-8-3]|nr:hypothetical protein DL769_002503 [Monosporascus sp. CRB-8-3]